MTTITEETTKATMTSPIIVNASNLAALIGRHPYTKRLDAFMTAWKSTDKTSYLAAHKRNHTLTVEQERRRIREASKFLQDDPSTDTLLKSLRAPNNARTFSSMASDVHASTIAEETRRLAYTRHGEEKEELIVDRVRKVLPEYDFVRHESMLRTCIGYTPNGRPVVLQGKIDGLSAGGDVVLECKTRVHKLFMSIRDYERIQVEAYLQLRPSASKALLVEAVFNVGPVPTINLMFVERSETANEWLPLAVAMGEVIERVLDDPVLQDAIVSTKNETIIRAALREVLAR